METSCCAARSLLFSSRAYLKIESETGSRWAVALMKCAKNTEKCSFKFYDYPDGVQNEIWQGTVCTQDVAANQVSSHPIKLRSSGSLKLNVEGRLINYAGREVVSLKDQDLPTHAPNIKESLAFEISDFNRYGDTLNFDVASNKVYSETTPETTSGGIAAQPVLHFAGVKSGKRYLGKFFAPFRPDDVLGDFELVFK